MLRKRTMLVSQIEDGVGNDVNCKLLLHFDNNTKIIDEIRFSNIARYTSNFTPPTSAYV